MEVKSNIKGGVPPDGSVTNVKLAPMATKTYKGRTSATTGVPEDVTVATLKADLALTKADVDLGNVDNTADSAKPVSTAQQTALDLKQSLSAKDAVSGYAGLDAEGKINPSQLPALAITDTFVVASQAAQLALTAEVGDVAVRTDLNKSFILRVTGAATLANWQELLTPTDAVSSIFGRSGAVTAQNNDYTAAQVANTPAGNIAATTVQAAIAELDAEKAPLASPTFTADAKTPPVDADFVLIMDSAAANILKKLTWANLKATLKTYFDTLYGAGAIIQALGVKNADFTVDIASGAYATVTTGSAAIAMTLTSPASSTNSYRLTVAILQGSTPRVVTLKTADANVISSGGLMSSGDALPNSGANTLDVFEFQWTGTKWETYDARYDVKA